MKVLLIDDHPVVRTGLVRLLQELARALDKTFEPVEAGSVSDAARQPDVFELVLLDLHFGEGPVSTEALAVTRTQFPSARIVVVSGDENPSLVRRCIELGASGFIPKLSAPEVMDSALRLVLAGGIYLPQLMLADLRMPRASTSTPRLPPEIATLSPRQIDVLRMAIRGRSNKVIARELNVSEGTVKQHLSGAFRALGVSNRTEAVYRAAELGLQFDPVPAAGATD
jgi:DNA-binding NarL/FixJ family response regulator